MKYALALLLLAAPALSEESLETSLLAAARQARAARIMADRAALPTPQRVFAELERKSWDRRAASYKPLRTFALPPRGSKRGTPIVFLLVLPPELKRAPSPAVAAYESEVAGMIDAQLRRAEAIYGQCGLGARPVAAITVEAPANEACVFHDCYVSWPWFSKELKSLAEDARPYGLPIFVAPRITLDYAGLSLGTKDFFPPRHFGFDPFKPVVIISLQLMRMFDEDPFTLAHELGHVFGMDDRWDDDAHFMRRALNGDPVASTALTPEQCAAAVAKSTALGRGLR